MLAGGAGGGGGVQQQQTPLEHAVNGNGNKIFCISDLQKPEAWGFMYEIFRFLKAAPLWPRKWRLLARREPSPRWPLRLHSMPTDQVELEILLGNFSGFSRIFSISTIFCPIRLKRRRCRKLFRRRKRLQRTLRGLQRSAQHCPTDLWPIVGKHVFGIGSGPNGTATTPTTAATETTAQNCAPGGGI